MPSPAHDLRRLAARTLGRARDEGARAGLAAAVRPVASSAVRRARKAGAAVRVRGELGLRRGRIAGLLSIVVPAYGVEDYIGECLTSLREQAYDRVEIIVVDDSSPDRSGEIAREHARRDPRVRVVRRPNGGLSAARNTGVDLARGEFLTFVDSDDTVARDCYTSAVGALLESGSDFAVNSYDRLEAGRLTPAGHWIRSAHARRRVSVSLDDFPDAMVNAVAWSKTYRRDFWEDAGLRFPEGRLYEDQPVSSRAFALARAFDVLPQVGVHWRIRHDRSSISQRQYTADNLAAHNASVTESLAELRTAGRDEAAETRALQLLANNMKFFARQLLRTDDAFRRLLREALVELWEQVPAERIARGVDAEDKVLFQLVMADRWDAAVDFVDAFGIEIRRFPTSRTPDGFRALLPHADSLDPRWSLLSDVQQELYVRVLRTWWDDSPEGAALQIGGWAYIRSIDLAANPPTVRAWLHPADRALRATPSAPTGHSQQRPEGRPGTSSDEPATIPLDVTLHSETRIDRMSGYWFCDYRPGGFTLTLPAERLPTEPGRWELRVEVEAGGVRRSGQVTENSHAGSSVVPRTSAARGLVHTVRWADGVVLETTAGDPPARAGTGDHGVAHDFWVADDTFEVELSHPGVPGAPVLHDPNLNEFAGELEELPGGRWLARFSLSTSRWGREGLALPQGKYAVSLRGPGGRPVGVVPDDNLLDRLPTEHALSRYRALGEVVPPTPSSPHATLALNLRVPLSEDEGGPRNQHRLRAQHRVERADRRAVVFRSLYGELANCNGLGLHEELVRRGTDLELLWSVQDYGVPVPAGGVPLIEGTREWHEALATARYHVLNLHQVEWFEKPEGQVMVETFHGYPYKVMGHEWWEKAGFTDSQVRSFDRRARDWDYFVSPATYATPLLRKAFLEPADATAEVLEVGYPRNDVLLRPEAEEVRRRTRELLGVRDDQTVSLYAPTFRDYLSADDMAAARIDFFEAEKAAKRLGEKHVLLIRGHAFNARLEGRVAGSRQVIDVTDHPDVNDLILASDAAILDYSSLRFDYALTDKPMIFFVPDLERYMTARGGVIPYEPTAPGPLVRTTDQVADVLGDLDVVRREWAQIRGTFRRQYTDLDDGHAAARLVEAVFAPRGDA